MKVSSVGNMGQLRTFLYAVCNFGGEILHYRHSLEGGTDRLWNIQLAEKEG